MAQVSIPPPLAAMSRRTPLTNLPNAINSPYNISTVTAKRARSQSTHARDVTYGQPPSKKQATENASVVRTPARRSKIEVETKAQPPKKSTVRSRPVAGGPPAFANLGQQSRKAQPKTQEEINQQSLDTVRAWQRHYRRAFPGYVFFFDSTPNAMLINAQRHIASLGATCEKFFSSKVTHVVTGRNLDQLSVDPPPQQSVSKPNGRTVNPSLLERGTNVPSKAVGAKSDRKPSMAMSKALHEELGEGEARRTGRGGNDILLKAQDYGMKVWQLDKLERVLNGLQDIPISHPTLTEPVARHSQQVAQTYKSSAHANADLSHLLRNEKLRPSDRDPNTVSKDLTFFKGPFVYVYDLTGASRPIMIRDYPKVQRREDGSWPQFRSVSGGKCPFIEERVHQSRDRDREQREDRPERKDRLVQKMKAPTVMDRMEVRRQEMQPERLRAVPRGRYVSIAEDVTDKAAPTRWSAAAPVPSVVPAKRSAPRRHDIAFTATNESATHRLTRCNQEPAASGVQPSNITSAIRSQVVSSHQDQPGQRAGTSKELFRLQKKVAGNVLLDNSVARGIAPSQKMIDLANAVNGTGERKLKRHIDGHEKVPALAKEDSGASTGSKGRTISELGKKKPVKKEPHPGYCENCREKFEDFEDHINTRRHRRFAMDDKNWVDLDSLLKLLDRPKRGQRA